MYALSDDKRIMKKLNKLQWNVFEELNVSIYGDVLLKYNTSAQVSYSERDLRIVLLF